jgi:hypothetical protein
MRIAGCILLIIVPASCGGGHEPVHSGPCQAPVGSPATDLLRVDGSISRLVSAGPDFVFTQLHGETLDALSLGLRRLTREGAAVDLAALPRFADVFLAAAGDDVFWGTAEPGAVVRRTELQSVPLAGGTPRTIGLVALDFSDDYYDTPRRVAPFAADDRAVYFTVSHFGANTPGGAWIGAVSKADGEVSVLGRASREVNNEQLVAGEIWWIERDSPSFVYRVPVQGPPMVETLAVRDCDTLLVEEDGAFFCGDITGITHYDRAGHNAELILDATNERGGGPTMIPFAVDREWLWILEAALGNVRKLHLSPRVLADVVCGDVQTRPFALGTHDLVWAVSQGEPATRTTLLRRVPR